MEAKLDEQALDEKLEALEKARAWSPRTISKLETFIRTADDFALFRVNPLRFGPDKNIAETEVIDLFLHAAKVGLFQMTWNLICPSCGSPVHSFAALKDLHADYYCVACDLRSSAALDDYIQVAFTVSPLVRDIIFHHPESLSAEDYAFKYHYSRGARLPDDGPEFAAFAASAMNPITYLQPGETKSIEFEFGEGIVILGAVIAAHSGAIVKTIGDAVMATFINPADGVQSALLILKEIEELNRGLGSKDVILKIGLHKGALIAVTLNDRLDYFGQTVNIAARVQSLADAEEIYLTDDIYEAPGVQNLLTGYQVSSGHAQLRGIEREVKVYKVVYHPA